MAGKIITHFDPKPIPDRQFDWYAVDENYDGAEDSSTRHEIGYGRTEAEAIADLRRLLDEKADWETPIEQIEEGYV